MLAIDGSALADPADRFALDFVELTIEGTEVPIPGALYLLGSACLLLIGRARGKR